MPGNAPEEACQVFSVLKLSVPSIVVINKIDLVKPDQLQKAIAFFQEKPYCKALVQVSRL